MQVRLSDKPRVLKERYSQCSERGEYRPCKMQSGTSGHRLCTQRTTHWTEFFVEGWRIFVNGCEQALYMLINAVKSSQKGYPIPLSFSSMGVDGSTRNEWYRLYVRGLELSLHACKHVENPAKMGKKSGV